MRSRPACRCLPWMALAVFLLLPQAPLAAQTPSKSPDQPMSQRATGTFQVKIVPLPFTTEEKADGAKMGRMSLDKQFEGDLVGTGKGQMLTVGTETKGSAVYVAVETVEGVLGGKKGTFALHHTGVMTRGQGELTVQVVPDSGTGELAGLTGKLSIKIEAGKHFYTLDYALP